MKKGIIPTLLLYACMCIQAQSTNWIEPSVRSKNYPNELYLKGFASAEYKKGESTEDLMKRLSEAARKELLESIEVSVSSESVLQVQENKASVNSSYQVQSKAKSDIEIANLKLEKWLDEKNRIAYVFMYARRAEVIDYYAGLIDIGKNNIENKVHEAKLYEASANNQKALQAYAKTISLFRDIEKYQRLLAALGVSDNALTKQQALGLLNLSIKDGINRITSKESIVVEVSDANRNAKFGEAIKDPLEVKVSLENESGKHPLENIPLLFTQDTTLYCALHTDANGRARCIVSNIKSKSKAQNIIASVDLESYLGIERRDVTSELFSKVARSGVFNVSVQAVNYLIRSEELDLNQKKINPLIEPQLKNQLGLYGLLSTNKESDADYVLKLTATPSLDTNQNEYGFFFVYLEVTLSVYEKISQQEVFTNSYSHVKGVSSSPMKAMSMAYKKSIDLIKKDIEILFKNKRL